jgi:hypothetical protein
MSSWPNLETPEWRESARTLHLWMQVVGKLRLELVPMINHWWHVPLYVTARGFGTGPMPCDDGLLEVELDLLASTLLLRTSTGGQQALELSSGRTLADLYKGFFEALKALNVRTHIFAGTVELPERIWLDKDQTVRGYNPEWGRSLFDATAHAQFVFEEFRSGFLGKASPVHFFWGSFDLAATRFSGRTAPKHPGGVAYCPDHVAVEAYSHEVSSAGFWPGGAWGAPPLFYSYAYPEPPGFSEAPTVPEAAHYDSQLKEFVLPYEAVRTSSTADRDLRAFLESTYLAAAELAHWDRDALERNASPEGTGQEPVHHLSV